VECHGETDRGTVRTTIVVKHRLLNTAIVLKSHGVVHVHVHAHRIICIYSNTNTSFPLTTTIFIPCVTHQLIIETKTEKHGTDSNKWMNRSTANDSHYITVRSITKWNENDDCHTKYIATQTQTPHRTIPYHTIPYKNKI
jgi:hypothetical protein